MFQLNNTHQQLIRYHNKINKNYHTLKKLQLTKNNDSSLLFDDGLLINFKLLKPEHLTFYCRKLNKDKDTCNVKLFKLGSMMMKDNTNISKDPNRTRYIMPPKNSPYSREDHTLSRTPKRATCSTKKLRYQYRSRLINRVN